MKIFNNDNFNYISDYVEEKISILKDNEDFNKSYSRLSDSIEELTQTLSPEQKENLDEIIQLVYKTEKYYFALAYSLGVKYGQDLQKL